VSTKSVETQDAQLPEQGEKNPSHIGWLPTVGGRLFFKRPFCSLASKRDQTCISHVERIDTQRRRWIFIGAKIDWEDQKAKRSAIEDHEYRQLRGHFVNLLFTNYVPTTKTIEGQIFITGYKAWLGDLLGKVHQLKDLIRNRKDYKKLDRIPEEISQFKEWLDEYNNEQVYQVDFTLDRYGFIKFSYIRRNGESNGDAHERTIIRHAYYFVKYSWHKHKHHDQTADCLTTVHPNLSDNETGQLILNDLKDSIVEITQNFNPRSRTISHVSGLLAYTKSLVVSLKRAGYLDPDQCRDELIYLQNMSDSADVLNDKFVAGKKRAEAAGTNFRAVLLFVMAIFTPLVLVLRDEISKGVNLDKEADSNSSVIFVKTAMDYSMSIPYFHFYLIVSLFVSYFAWCRFYVKYDSIIDLFTGWRSWVEAGKNRPIITSFITVVLLTFLAMAILKSFSL